MGNVEHIALLVGTYVVVLGVVPAVARRRGRMLVFGTLLGHFTFWSSWFAVGATFRVAPTDVTVAALVAGGAPPDTYVRLTDASFAPERAVELRVGGRKKGNTSYIARFVPVSPAGGDGAGPVTVVWFDPTPTDTLPARAEGRLSPLEGDMHARLAAAGLRVARPAWQLDTTLPGWRGPLLAVLIASVFGWGMDLLAHRRRRAPLARPAVDGSRPGS